MKRVKSLKADSLPPDLKKHFDSLMDDKYPMPIDEALEYIKKNYAGYYRTEGTYPYDVQVYQLREGPVIKVQVTTQKTRKAYRPVPRPDPSASQKMGWSDITATSGTGYGF